MSRRRADRPARELERILTREGVRVVRHNTERYKLGPGDTRARGTLMRIMQRRGPEFLVDLIRAIREPGEMSSDTLRAMEQIFTAFPSWRDMDLADVIQATGGFIALRRHAPHCPRDRVAYLAQRMGAQLAQRIAAHGGRP
jgi:hypothetical protein